MGSSQGVAKGSVVTATLLAMLALLAVAFQSSPAPVDRAEGSYWGARILPPGPAPRGLPILGVDAQDDGTLHGIPTHLHWYRYSGHEASPGLLRGYPGDDRFVYDINPERLLVAHAQGLDLWWEGLLGQTVRAQDFPADWKAAPAVWRTEPGADRMDSVPVIVMRVDRSAYAPEIRDEFAPDGFLAFAGYDTRLGCEVGYEINDNPKSLKAPDHPVIYDSCHDSRYDPRDIRRYDMSQD